MLFQKQIYSVSAFSNNGSKSISKFRECARTRVYVCVVCTIEQYFVSFFVHKPLYYG